jgi:hypothetical protein
MDPIIAEALKLAIPLAIEELAKLGVITAAQKDLAQGIVVTEEFIGSLQFEDKFPAGVNGATES